ncbi:hypothetical protein CGCVW01_v000159 [Colletotrichum viniferum]|nr:hypothetical protein CGCVW01_v000159 [Colletotrichum viniferum]
MAPEKPVSKAAANSRSAVENHRASNKHDQNKALEKVQIPATAKQNKDSVVDKKATIRRPPPPRHAATHQLPSEEQKKANGRYPGRQLVQWNRQPVAEKLLLALVFECEKKGLELPWDETAHRFRPSTAGNALKQQMVRLQAKHLKEGRVVPPRGNLRGYAADRNVRGVVLDKETGQKRTVGWDEKVDEPDCFPVDDQTIIMIEEGEEDEEEEIAPAVPQAPLTGSYPFQQPIDPVLGGFPQMGVPQMGRPQMGIPLAPDAIFNGMPTVSTLPFGTYTELPGAHQFSSQPGTMAGVPDLDWAEAFGSANKGSELPPPVPDWDKYMTDTIPDNDGDYCK